MKKLLIVFCCAFTAVTLFCSFNVREVAQTPHLGNMVSYGCYRADLLKIDGQEYIVVQSGEGIGICKK